MGNLLPPTPEVPYGRIGDDVVNTLLAVGVGVAGMATGLALSLAHSQHSSGGLSRVMILFPPPLHKGRDDCKVSVKPWR